MNSDTINSRPCGVYISVSPCSVSGSIACSPGDGIYHWHNINAAHTTGHDGEG